ncbi:MAG: ATP-binding protein [Candidatus Njordarchaeia archaeon]|nr:ATP-binding protein [Candidatus Korarchaeota archaeon]
MEEYNPWWFGEEHFKFSEWKSYRIKWIPEILKRFHTEGFSLNFLIGPRQIGKTMSIILFIHTILLRKYKPESIFYYSCDELTDFRELGEILDNYYNYRKSMNVRKSIIFLDEVTFVEEWWRALKSRIDQGLFKNDVIYVSGSASIELISGKERFPGRRGYGRDYYMFPMDFSEYLRVLHKVPIVAQKFDLEKLEEIIDVNRIFKEKIFDIFQRYLVTGGFPLAIREFYENGRITSAYKTYIDWLKSDITKSKRNERLVKEILSLIIRARLSPVSWNRISKEVSASSPNTVRDYIEFLENLFVLKVVPYIDLSGRIMYRKRKKIHIVDPFLYNTISRFVKEKVYEDQVVESVVVSHLSRIFDVYYWKNSKEIDSIIKQNSKLFGFEVKWSFKPYDRRYPIKTMVLDKEKIPLLLAGVNWNSFNPDAHTTE